MEALDARSSSVLTSVSCALTFTERVALEMLQGRSDAEAHALLLLGRRTLCEEAPSAWSI
eukprot:1143363-Pelagomonas_calceolata.AAC.7